MKSSIFVGLMLVAMSGAVLADGFTFNPFMLLVPKDATRSATKMAEGIQNRPECQKFKDEIMSHSKESASNAGTGYSIGLVKEKAKKAGCAQ